MGFWDKFKRPKPTTEAGSIVEEIIVQEQLDRRVRSIKLLKRNNIPTINHLPVIESKAQSIRRSLGEVIERAYALSVVAERAHNPDVEFINTLITQYNVSGFTDNEKLFIDDKNPSEQDLTNFSWRSEALYVLLWALGHVDEMTVPDSQQNFKDLYEPIATKSRYDFEQYSNLRPQEEILDQADLIYRVHWAVRNAKGGKVPGNLSASVVMERHYTFNWLVGYMKQEWDDISTDT